MTRRALLTALSAVAATILALAVLPMQMAPLAVAGAWVGLVIVFVVAASALSAALERREQRAEFSDVLREARRALR